MEGYLYWEAAFAKTAPYIDGYEAPWLLEGLTWEEGAGVFVLPTHAGTHIVQTPYLSAAAPRARIAIDPFRMEIPADDEETYFRLSRAAQRGAPIDFCPFIWRCDVFQAIATQTYTLTRRVAWGVVPGVTSGTHPARFFLNDVEDAGSASIASQTLTANNTGVIAARYLPVFKVVVRSISDAIQGVNDLVRVVTLSEVIQTS